MCHTRDPRPSCGRCSSSSAPLVSCHSSCMGVTRTTWPSCTKRPCAATSDSCGWRTASDSCRSRYSWSNTSPSVVPTKTRTHMPIHPCPSFPRRREPTPLLAAPETVVYGLLESGLGECYSFGDKSVGCLQQANRFFVGDSGQELGDRDFDRTVRESQCVLSFLSGNSRR